MSKALKPNGEFAIIDGHKIHVFRKGNPSAQKVLFLSGHCTVSPVYDFKVLYEKLWEDYRVIVIEKFGYGYSDIFDAPSDIDSTIAFYRNALASLGEEGPFVLAPHSLGGLEAIRWKQLYPDEVRGLIGIDMAMPEAFIQWWDEEKVAKTVKTMKKWRWLAKLLGSTSNLSLSEEEIKQHKLLKRRNVFNICHINEAKGLLTNTKTVEEGGPIRCPALIFVSSGEGQEPNWVELQNKFAKDMNAKLVPYDCGHYIHQFQSENMAREIKGFMETLS